MKKFLICMLAGIGLGTAIAACKPSPTVCDVEKKVVDTVSTSVSTAFACENPAALKDAITKVADTFNLCPKAKTGIGLGVLCDPAITLLLAAGLPAEAKCSGGAGKAAAVAACQALLQ